MLEQPHTLPSAVTRQKNLPPRLHATEHTPSRQWLRALESSYIVVTALHQAQQVNLRLFRTTDRSRVKALARTADTTIAVTAQKSGYTKLHRGYSSRYRAKKQLHRGYSAKSTYDSNHAVKKGIRVAGARSHRGHNHRASPRPSRLFQNQPKEPRVESTGSSLPCPPVVTLPRGGESCNLPTVTCVGCDLQWLHAAG